MINVNKRNFYGNVGMWITRFLDFVRNGKVESSARNDRVEGAKERTAV
jgi:hypothetical protein